MTPIPLIMDKIEAIMLSVGDAFYLEPSHKSVVYFCLMVSSKFVYARSNVSPLVLERVRPFQTVYVDNFYKPLNN